MTSNEIELINLIRENDNPEEALAMALDSILFFLTAHEAYQERTLACLRESS